MRINLTTPMSDDKERQRQNAAMIAAIEQYTEERMNDENTDGSRSGGQPVLKPCPFCGEQCAALLINQGDKWAHYEPTCLEVRTGYNLSNDAPWRDEAIAAWNIRQPTQGYATVATAGSDRIGGGGGLPCGAVGVATQREITQADIDAAESIFWVETIIDDHEAVAKAFARHHQHGYDQGYYDGCANPIVRHDALREALAHIAFSGADGPYGHFGEALNEHQMRRVARAALEQSK